MEMSREEYRDRCNNIIGYMASCGCRETFYQQIECVAVSDEAFAEELLADYQYDLELKFKELNI